MNESFFYFHKTYVTESSAVMEAHKNCVKNCRTLDVFQY